MTIEAMKQALEALEKLWEIIDDIDTYGDMAKNDDKLFRALVERKQRTRFEATGISTDGQELSGGAITILRTAIEQAEKQEPVAIVSGYYGGQCVVLPTNPARLFNSGTAFYTTPQPQRQWVGLTDEERKEIAEQCIQPLIFLVKDHAISIEAKLKEKNDSAQLQPLTDEDIALIDWESLVTRKDCVRAIEAKLRRRTHEQPLPNVQNQPNFYRSHEHE